MVGKNEKFVKTIVWSDEAQFKLNGTVNLHNFVYWASGNLFLHVEKAVNLPGVDAGCGASAKVLIKPFFFEGTETGQMYLDLLCASILSAIHVLYRSNKFSFNKRAHSNTYSPDARAYLDENVQRLDRTKRRM
uniref:Uncharacterized protein n=1 Tax=Octopus bimaculoides TaxID=37653 RepID=A0A0L8FTA5_OCTBM